MKTGKCTFSPKYVRYFTFVLVLTLFLVPCISADGYVGGIPLSTVQSGTVSGGLYIDADPPAWGPTDVIKTFLPIPSGVDIAWARLYVAVYSGTMQNNYPGTANVSFDGDGDGLFETVLGFEMLDTPGGYTYPGEGGTGPIAVNDHCNRVTSDFFVWYDVTSLISSDTPKARVVTEKVNASFDGRIKMMTLLVAYNDRDTDEIHYWVNEGHDIDSYLADNSGMPYTGQTTFDLSVINAPIESAILTVNHLASTDGNYTWNDQPIAAGTLETQVQGSYSGFNSWNVTPGTISGQLNAMTYDRKANYYKIPLAALAVKKAATPPGDLEVTFVNPVTGNVFAKEPNTVRITVRNNGAQQSSPTEVHLTSSDGFDGRGSVPSIPAGQTTIVSVTDTLVRNLAGGTVTYTATVDPDNLVPETNEGNNQKSSTTKTVLYNGYKGARYWEGKSDILTSRTFDLRGGLLSSPGDSTYRAGGVGGSGWSSYTVTWTGADLPLPAGSTVREARLYVPYTWDDSQQVPDHFHLTFNGNATAHDAHYTDQSNFGGYANHHYGLLAYNVTQWFNPAGNTALLTKDNVNTNLAIYGLTLAVVYEDTSDLRRQVFLAEGFDILGADETQYGTTPEEATAYLPFTGMTISPGDASHAWLTTFVPSGNGPEGNLLWNGATIGTNVWDYGPSTGTQVAVDTRDVKNSLLASGNEAGIRSTAPGATPLMTASHAFLVVEYPETGPVADFAANVTSGAAPLTVAFTDMSSGTITSYAWDFQNDGVIDSTEQNPVYTYASQGIFTVNLTVTGQGGSAREVKSGFITVTGPSHPDLVITQLSTNGNELFAHEPNTINATVRNNGTASAGPFTVRIDASGAEYDVAIPGLHPGAQQEVQVNDTTLRTAGDIVTLTATADPDNVIAESDESNNALSLTMTVMNNGYKGKRWTGGSDLETIAAFEGRVGMAYSTGNATYRAAGWSSATTHWTASDIPVPGTATILSARLSQGYTYDQTPGGIPAWTAQFNGQPVAPEITYTDRKGYGSYNYPSGLLTYNVTSLFSKTGNTFTITPGAGNNNGLYGSLLVVVYEDSGEPVRKILINEECDMLYAGAARFASDDEATAYAPFGGVDTAGLGEAHLLAFLFSANEAGKSAFIFNGHDYGDLSPGYLAGPQVTLREFNVTNDVAQGENTALFRSVTVGASGDNMVAAGAILIAEYTDGPPVAVFSAIPTNGTVPLSVQFTDNSTGAITERTWEFRPERGVWTQFSTASSPSYTFTDAATYDIRLTVRGPGGEDQQERAGYITVLSEPAPSADFSASPLTGTAPLSVQFTDNSTGAITDRTWEFRPERGVWTQFSTASSPSYTFTDAATYDIRLTVRGPGGESTEQKMAYISVLPPGGLRADFAASPISGVAPLSVQFTDQSTGTVTLRTWDFNNDGRWDSISSNPVYRFWNPGVYTVRLAVSGPEGSDQIVKDNLITVTVPPKPPVARFTQDTKVGNAPLTVRFTDLSTGSPESYLWTFGDGGTSTDPSPVHTYQAPGLYRVTFRVENEGGTSTATGYAYVIRPIRPS